MKIYEKSTLKRMKSFVNSNVDGGGKSISMLMSMLYFHLFLKQFIYDYFGCNLAILGGFGGMEVRTAYESVMTEIDIMQELSHQNVIRLFEVINDKDSDLLLLILDYAKYGELMIWDESLPLDDENAKTCIPGKDIFTEMEVQRIAKDIIKGIDYMHRNNIVHRDIKPQNIMLDRDGCAKIGDFGSAERFLDNDMLTETKGTYLFLSPE